MKPTASRGGANLAPPFLFETGSKFDILHIRVLLLLRQIPAEPNPRGNPMQQCIGGGEEFVVTPPFGSPEELAMLEDVFRVQTETLAQDDRIMLTGCMLATLNASPTKVAQNKLKGALLEKLLVAVHEYNPGLYESFVLFLRDKTAFNETLGQEAHWIDATAAEIGLIILGLRP